jgi:addiction module RelE/StbE family toxin
MKIEKIYYSSHFEKVFTSLPSKVKRQAVEKERVFRKDCFDKSLKTHKLKGKLKNIWAFSINHSYRIIFKFDKNNDVGLIDIGTHSIYV